MSMDFVSDRYECISCLGSGGASVVYKARDHHQHRFCAIKQLHPERKKSPRARAHLRQEFVLASGISHPNWIEVYEYVEHDHTASLVMAWIDGKSLYHVAADLDFQTDQEVFHSMANALDAVHEQGVIYCDFKPRNVILTNARVPIFIDLGISFHLSTPPPPEPRSF